MPGAWNLLYEPRRNGASRRGFLPAFVDQHIHPAARFVTEVDEREVETRKSRSCVELLTGDEHQPRPVDLEGVARAFVFDLFELDEGLCAHVKYFRDVGGERRPQAGRNVVELGGVRTHVATHPQCDPTSDNDPERRDDEPWRTEARRVNSHRTPMTPTAIGIDRVRARS